MDGRSERPATGYGEPEAGALPVTHDRPKAVLHDRVDAAERVGVGERERDIVEEQ